MNKNAIVKNLTNLKYEKIDLDDCILEMIAYEEYELVEELELLYEVNSKAKFDKRLEELILDIEDTYSTCRRITKRDLLENKVVKKSVIDSLNELIHEILKDN